MANQPAGFGTFIKKYRVLNKLSQTELARRLNIAREHLSRIECGRHNLQFEKLEILSQVFKIALPDVKKEFYSDLFASEIFYNDCPEAVLEITRLKVEHLKSNAKRL